MNTDKKELNINEMEQTSGGGRLGTRNSSRETKFDKMASEWFDNTVIPAVGNFGSAVCTVSKAAFNWVTGLFSGK